MNDDEYRDYLLSLARIHLNVMRLYSSRPTGGTVERLAYAIERLSSLSRLLRAVRDRSENQVLISEFVDELRGINEEDLVSQIIEAMEDAGILAALDEAPEVTLANLRRSAIPDEDIHMLARAGIDHPEAEMSVVIQRARFRWIFYTKELPSNVIRQAPQELRHAAEILADAARPEGPETAPRKRKLFNGIGKVLAGSVAGGGNVLLALGTIVAPNPATAFGAIGSSAWAVLYISQGIGDLRGE